MLAVRFVAAIACACVILAGDAQVNGPIEVQVSAAGDTTVDAPIVVDLDTTVQPGENSNKPDRHTNQEPPHKMVDSSAHMKAILQRELESIDTLIKLQQRKLETLEELREQVLLHPETVASTDKRGHKLSSSDVESLIDRQLATVVAHAASDAARARFDSYFIERAVISLPDDVVDVKTDTLRLATHVDVVAIARQNGDVMVYAPIGEVPVIITTGLKEICGVEMDLGSSPPLLAVFADDAIAVYALNQAAAAATSTGTGAANENGRQGANRNVLVPKEHFRLGSGHLAGQSIDGIAIARSARRSVVAIGGSDGVLRFLATNGTSLHDVTTPSASLAALATHSQWFAFPKGSEVLVFRMSRQKAPEFIVCQGSQSQVKSIKFDPYHPETLYASTDDGEILTLAINLHTDVGSQAPVCRLVTRIVVQRSQPQQLAVVNGYLIAASPSEINVFNTTGATAPVALLPTRVCTSRVDDRDTIVGFSVIEGPHATSLALLKASTDGRTQSLTLLQSLLPSEPSIADSSAFWRPLSFVGMVALAVVTAQCFLRRSPGNESDGFGDVEQLRKLMERHGRSSMDRVPGASSGAFNRHKQPRAPTIQQPYLGDQAMLSATVDAFLQDKTKKAQRNEDQGYDEEYRKTVEQARRETLECSFDEDEY